MAECGYCAKITPKGTGMLFVFKTGKTTWFCSSKCEKHQLKLKRKSQKMKWVTSVKKK